MMKRILGLLGLLAISGCLSSCVTDVSKQPPYDQLVGTTWRLKKDAFIVRIVESDYDSIVPSDDQLSMYLPTQVDWPYSEDKFGSRDEEIVIKGGLRSGRLLHIIRVEKHPSYALGDQYIPIAVEAGPKNYGKELSLGLLYDDYTDHGDLNPEGKLKPKYAERVK